MVWTPLDFTSGDILKATELDQMQANFTALAQQDSGSPKIDVSCAASVLFEAESVITSGIRAGVASFGTLDVTSAKIENIDFDTLVVSDFRAGVGSFGTLHAGSATFDNIELDSISVSDGIISALSADIINVQSGNIDSLISSEARFGVASISALHVGSAVIDNLDLDTLVLSNIQADIASFNIVVTSEFQTDNASVAILQAQSGNIESLISSDFRSGVVSISNLHVGSAAIDNLSITDLNLETLTVSDLRAGVGSLTDAGIGVALIDSATITDLISPLISAETIITTDFAADAASVNALNVASEFVSLIANIGSAEIDNLLTETLIASDARIGVGSINLLHSNSANINDFTAVFATINSSEIESLISSNARIGIGSLNILSASSGQINDLLTNNFQTDNASIGILTANSANIESLISSDFRSGVASINLLHSNSGFFINLYVESETNLTKNDEWLQNGFVDQTQSTIAFSDTNRRFVINRTGTAFEYFVAGEKYTVTSDDQAGYNAITLGDSEGLHAIYYDTSTLANILEPTGTQFVDLVLNKALTAIVYYNASSNEGILYDERHGANMAPRTHSYLHQIVGFAYISGLGLGDFVISTGADNEDAQFSIASGVCFDEDLSIDLNAIDSTTATKVFFRDGTNWRWRTQTGFKCITLDGTSATRLAYDDSGTLTAVTNGRFVLIHVFASNAADGDCISIVGQAQYNNANDAKVGAETEINNLVLSGLPTKELKPIGSIIFETKDTFANDVNARVIQTDAGENYVDWRTTPLAAGVSAADHGSLGGLGDDDHLQYALLAGRDGGQILIGGESSGDILTFQSCDGIQFNNELRAENIINSGTISDAASFNITNVISGNIESLISSDFRAGVASVNLLHVNSANIQNLDIGTIITSDLAVDIASINTLNVASNFNSLIADIGIADIQIGNIDNVAAESIVTSGLRVGAGSFTNLNAGILESDSATIADLIATNLIGETASFDTIEASSNFQTTAASVALLHVNSATIDNINITDLVLDTLIVSDMRAGVGSISNLHAGSAAIDNLSIADLTLETLVASDMRAGVGSFSLLYAGSANIGYLDVDSGLESYFVNISSGGLFVKGTTDLERRVSIFADTTIDSGGGFYVRNGPIEQWAGSSMHIQSPAFFDKSAKFTGTDASVSVALPALYAENSSNPPLALYNTTTQAAASLILGVSDVTSPGRLHFIVSANGDVLNTNGVYTTISDRRLKNNINTPSDKLEKVLQIPIVTYHINQSSEKLIGYIAQDVQEIFPSLVSENASGYLYPKNSVLGSPILMKAFQEHVHETRARVTSLEAQITSLTALMS